MYMHSKHSVNRNVMMKKMLESLALKLLEVRLHRKSTDVSGMFPAFR